MAEGGAGLGRELSGADGAGGASVWDRRGGEFGSEEEFDGDG